LKAQNLEEETGFSRSLSIFNKKSEMIFSRRKVVLKETELQDIHNQ